VLYNDEVNQERRSLTSRLDLAAAALTEDRSSRNLVATYRTLEKVAGQSRPVSMKVCLHEGH
jgi:hypothetical protein